MPSPDALPARAAAVDTYRAALPAIVHARERRPFDEDLFRSHLEALAALGRGEEADLEFRAFAAGATPTAWLIAQGLRWSRSSAHAEHESRFRELATGRRYELADLRWLAEILGVVQYFDFTRAEIAALYRQYNALMQRSAAPPPARAPRRPPHGRRLRVGYLSSDFRRHVMGDLMLEVFARHDRDRYQVFAYSTLAEGAEDATTSRFRGACDHFVPLGAVDDATAAGRIAADDLDLLVDLAGTTPQARPGILLRKPAPVIVAHLGDHGAIGLEQVDYKITDAVADLPDAASYQIERPLIMRHCVMPFRRVAPAPPAPTGRAGAGVPAGATVFGAFCASLKLSPRCLGLWRRILEAVPNGCLALSPFTRRDLDGSVSRLVAAGIPARRLIVIQPSADDAMNRARYRNVDVLLDTLPYCGGDSTVAALDMGVPVVTRAGERQAERMGLSILSHLGVTDTVARSDDEYVVIASRLAADPGWRSALSARILARIPASGIADFGRYCRSLEDAYERALGRPGGTAERRAPD